MRRRILLAAMVILLAFTAATRAADPPAGDAAIAPFINEKTFLVIRVEVDAIDVKAAGAWMEKALKSADIPEGLKATALKQLPGVQAGGQQWADEFKQAGGKQIYVELNLAGIHDGPVVIVPMRDGADASALENLFATGSAKTALDEQRSGRQFAISHGCMLFAGPRGISRELKTRQPAARPDLSIALAEGGDAPIRVAFIPSDEAKAMLSQGLPQMPPKLGGVSIADVLNSLNWAQVSVSMSPAPSVKLVGHFKDADSAVAAVTALKTTHDAAQNSFDTFKATGHMSEADQILGNLIPLAVAASDGDKFTFSLDGTKADTLGSVIFSAVVEQRIDTARMISMSHLRQIGQAILLYANDNNNTYPPDFATLLLKGDYTTAGVFLSPTTGNSLPANWEQMSADEKGKWVNEKSDYIFLGAGQTNAGASNIAVAYERQARGATESCNVLFADGHVEYVAQDDLKKILEQTKAAHDQAK